MVFPSMITPLSIIPLSLRHVCLVWVADGKILFTSWLFQKITKIVHLEMVNIILALRVFGPMWKGKKITIKCDNDAVVKVLSHGRARDPVWLLVPGMRGTLQLTLILTHHMSMGKNNQSLTVI